MFDHTLDLCRSLPAVITEKKWDNEMRFYVGEKLFCMISLDPLTGCHLNAVKRNFIN